jgi:hypothetical protein
VGMTALQSTSLGVVLVLVPVVPPVAPPLAPAPPVAASPPVGAAPPVAALPPDGAAPPVAALPPVGAAPPVSAAPPDGAAPPIPRLVAPPLSPTVLPPPTPTAVLPPVFAPPPLDGTPAAPPLCGPSVVAPLLLEQFNIPSATPIPNVRSSIVRTRTSKALDHGERCQPMLQSVMVLFGCLPISCQRKHPIGRTGTDAQRTRTSLRVSTIFNVDENCSARTYLVSVARF